MNFKYALPPIPLRSFSLKSVLQKLSSALDEPCV